MILYCCIDKTGKQAKLANNSITSLKSNGKYSGPISVLTDTPELFNNVTIIDPNSISITNPKPTPKKYTSRPYKILGWQSINDNNSIFLDNDTQIISDISGIWDFTGDFGLVVQEKCETFNIAKNRMKQGELVGDINLSMNIVPKDGPFFNSGVIAIKDIAKWKIVVQKWYNEWNKVRWTDQYALLRAIQGQNVSSLPKAYNSTTNTNGAIIWHFYHDKNTKNKIEN